MSDELQLETIKGIKIKAKKKKKTERTKRNIMHGFISNNINTLFGSKISQRKAPRNGLFIIFMLFFNKFI